jgi:hypothetical protein
MLLEHGADATVTFGPVWFARASRMCCIDEWFPLAFFVSDIIF